MSSGKRKLSFLGFAPQTEAGEDEVRLDDEMERVVWSEGSGASGVVGPRLPPPATPAQPLRDAAAPPPHPTDPPPYTPELEETRHVQFGGEEEDGEEGLDDADDERRTQRKARHLHHKARKYSLQEGGAARGAAGTAVGAGSGSEEPLGEPHDEPLDGEARAHRSENVRTPHRHHPQHRGSTVHVSRKDGGDKVQNILSDSAYKKMYDHSPHSVFVQLDELLGAETVDGVGSEEWRETARWIKYEEDVEEGSARWGRPHVASLSFHSLLNLRRCLETGVVLLDLEEKDLPGVAYRIVERMAAEQLLEEDDRPLVMRALLLRHKHPHDDRLFRFSISGAVRKHSSYTSLQVRDSPDDAQFLVQYSLFLIAHKSLQNSKT